MAKEDVIEINCHGGIVTTNKVLELLLLNGCRLAEPGEFSKRAFYNNKMEGKYMKRLVSIILSVILVLSSAPFAFASEDGSLVVLQEEYYAALFLAA